MAVPRSSGIHRNIFLAKRQNPSLSFVSSFGVVSSSARPPTCAGRPLKTLSESQVISCEFFQGELEGRLLTVGIKV